MSDTPSTDPAAAPKKDTDGAFIGQIRRGPPITAILNGITEHGDVVEGSTYIPSYQQWTPEGWKDL